MGPIGLPFLIKEIDVRVGPDRVLLIASSTNYTVIGYCHFPPGARKIQRSEYCAPYIALISSSYLKRLAVVSGGAFCVMLLIDSEIIDGGFDMD